MDQQEFIRRFFDIARQLGYKVEINGNGQQQVDFGHKKLHAGHLQRMFPAVLEPGANVARITDEAAPGRPCAHRPSREILARMVA